jgi:hypothetical protein
LLCRVIINCSSSAAMIDNLIAKTFAWEDERNVPFLYDGVSCCINHIYNESG